MARQIKQIKEEPFTSFSQRLESYYKIADELEDDDDVLDEDNSEEIAKLVNKITVAYIEREIGLVKTQLGEKGITEVFPVAAMVYSTWKNRSRRDDPVLTAEQSGIPALRRFLFVLPAKRNYTDYYEHVFETLPAFRTKAGCVAEKHVEDKTYGEMRHNFKQTVPILEQELHELSAAQIETLIAKPWLPSERKDIYNAIRDLIWRDWIQARIHFGGFAKMIRERGIPMNGKYAGHNLNADLVATMVPYIEAWYKNMLPNSEQLTQCLEQPILGLLAKVTDNITATEADPDLKTRALSALGDARRRITTARSALLIELETALRDTRIHFTTEIDILCPLAKIMKSVFKDAQHVPAGAGVYEKQRLCIANAITPDPKNSESVPKFPLAEKMEGRVVKRLKKAWKTCCSTFITRVIAHLNDFSATTERLLVNEAYWTEEHRSARKVLKGLLREFDKGLKAVQRKFTGEEEDEDADEDESEEDEDEDENEEEEEPPEKKIKLEGLGDEVEISPKVKEEVGVLDEVSMPITAPPEVNPEEMAMSGAGSALPTTHPAVEPEQTAMSDVPSTPPAAQAEVRPEETTMPDAEPPAIKLEPGETVVPIQLTPGWFHATFPRPG
jgi:hypothetical protein